MFTEFVRAIKVTLLLVVLLCGIYPGAVWVIGNVFFHEQANGGIVYRDGHPVGAKLIGQAFSRQEYFHPRPSAAGENGYDAAQSSGSNLGPTSQKLANRVSSDVAQILKENPTLSKGQIPVNLVTSSGSGLDPDISPQAAFVQIDRVAKARSLSRKTIEDLVRKYTQGPQWGLFGAPRVNVLTLNLALDQLRGAR